MNKHTDSRARRVALVTAAAAVALWGSFGAAVHADDEPVADPPVETGESGGAIVAVGAPPVPPVPPAPVVVAVGLPPVPPAPVIVAVGAPPVPPARVSGRPANIPDLQHQAKAPNALPATPAAAVGMRRPAAVTEHLTVVFADLIARIEAILARLTVGF